MADTRVRFALSSDAPVASYRPFDTVLSAVTRTTVGGALIGESQALSVEEALRACTHDAAASYFADDRLGTLEVGKLADLVVLEADPFTTAVDRLGDIAVEMTLLGGEIVYEAARRTATSDSIS
jgi:predicted amidohydrolase YtcJ